MKASWTRDKHGIPQIVADDIIGLYWGMGYCHAMDQNSALRLMRFAKRTARKWRRTER